MTLIVAPSTFALAGGSASLAVASLAPVGSLGTATSAVASSSMTLTTTTDIAAGQIGVLLVASANTTTYQGDNGEHVAVTDSAGAVAWTRIAEATKTNGVVADGATSSQWVRPRQGSTLAAGASVLVSFADAPTDKACSGYIFSARADLKVLGTVTDVPLTYAPLLPSVAAFSLTGRAATLTNLSSGTFPAPAYPLPSFASFNSATGRISGDPIPIPAMSEYTGTVRPVTSQATLQSALNAMVERDIIEQQADFTITGSGVQCPDRGFTGVGVLFREQTRYATISALARRTVAADFATGFTITDNTETGWIFASQGASRLYMLGLKVVSGWTSLVYQKTTCINWNPSVQTTVAHQPRRMIVDRCSIVNPWTAGGSNYCRRGIILGGRDNIVRWSRIEGMCSSAGDDSQAIWVPTNCEGVSKIYDNFLEGAAENILIGGTSSGMGAGVEYASHILIQYNHLFKRLAWLTDPTVGGQLKNLGEQKAGSWVTWDSNVHENFDGDAAGVQLPKGGQPYDWTVNAKAQNSTDGTRVRCINVNLRNSLFINSYGKVNVANAVGVAQAVTDYIHIYNVRWMNTMAVGSTDNRFKFTGTNTGSGFLRGVIVEKTTSDCTNNFVILATGGVGTMAGFVFRDNVNLGDASYYGISANASNNGDTACNSVCGTGQWEVAGNVTRGSNNASRPKWTGTIIAAANQTSLTPITVDSDGTLTDARYLTAGVGGVRPGVDGAHLAAMIAGVRE